MISSAIGFRVEGAIPVDLIDAQKIKGTVNVNSSSSDIEKAGLTIGDVSDIPNLLLGVFDISDSDYLFYRDQIVVKGKGFFRAKSLSFQAEFIYRYFR
jgi:hypothetical protein